MSAFFEAAVPALKNPELIAATAPPLNLLVSIVVGVFVVNEPLFQEGSDPTPSIVVMEPTVPVIWVPFVASLTIEPLAVTLAEVTPVT